MKTNLQLQKHQTKSTKLVFTKQGMGYEKIIITVLRATIIHFLT